MIQRERDTRSVLLEENEGHSVQRTREEYLPTHHDRDTVTVSDRMYKSRKVLFSSRKEIPSKTIEETDPITGSVYKRTLTYGEEPL